MNRRLFARSRRGPPFGWPIACDSRPPRLERRDEFVILVLHHDAVGDADTTAPSGAEPSHGSAFPRFLGGPAI